MVKKMTKNLIKTKITGNKKAILSLSLILMLTMTLIMAFAQPSLAQIGVPQPEKTVGYITVAPTLIGVGQQLTVNLWLFPLPQDYLYGNYYPSFSGVTVTFIKPDGTQDTFAPVDATGAYAAGHVELTASLFFYYTPQMAGNWSVSFTMPAQNITDSTGTVQYLGCTSSPATFTVQTGTVLAGLLNGYPWAELPNSNVYWSYPINSNNREWSQISGDWLGSHIFGSSVQGVTCRLWQPYGTGPSTAHIVWDYNDNMAGIIGGAYGSTSYSNVFSIPDFVIVDGKLIVNVELNSYQGSSKVNGFEGIDLATGHVLYTANGTVMNALHLPGNPYAQTSAANGIVLANSYGAIPTPYLFGTSGSTWNYYDPFTGLLMRQIFNASSSYKIIDGTNLAYATASNVLECWNITRVVNNNWPTGITWTTTLPRSLLNSYPAIFGVSTDASTIICKTANQYYGYSAKDGSSIWNLTLNYPVITNEQMTLYGVDDFVVWDPTASSYHMYSMLTGAQLWESPSIVTSSSPWASTWTIYLSETNDLNNFYVMLPDGTIAAMSLATGQIVWRSTAIPSTEYTENAVPDVIGLVMVGGNIYAYGGYSVLYQLDPIPRFGLMACVNATTGDITYTLNGGVMPNAAADGYVIAYGQNDGNVYCVGKGTTSTTVSAPQTAITAGTPVIIQGSVLDKSPASSDATLTAMFPNGVPAISDDNMSVWMDYLHMQNSTLLNTPPAVNGIPVTLNALDSNGNYMTLGTTTSDGSGSFKYQWTPITPGIYTLYATFAGSNSYYSSYAETGAIVAASAATSTPAPTATSAPSNLATTSDLMTYIAVVGIAIIIAIAIVGALILSILRKK